MSRAKKPLPEGMAAIADEAAERLLARSCAPRIAIRKTKDGWCFDSPYEDGDRWFVLLADAFGTRHGGVVEHFLNRLVELVPHEWDEKRQRLTPKQDEFEAMLAIVAALQPENEAQAAHAAQLAALDMSAMRLGRQSQSYADPRTAAILAKTVRAYGDGMERLARLQGRTRPRSIKQTIEVHKHEHIHFEGEASPNGDRPHGTDGGATVPRPALPGPQSGGTTLRIPSGEGQESVSATRWSAWFWRTLGRAQRFMAPR